MITEQQQEQASLYAAGALTADERGGFEADLRGDAELRRLVRELQRTMDLFTAASTPLTAPPSGLRDKVLQRIEPAASTGATRSAQSCVASAIALGFRFLAANDPTGWKQLPVPGAWIKLLSVDRERGYAVLLGKLDAGARYPAHTHEGSEDLYLLTGDLHLGATVLGAGDFHHSDAGTSHGENYSVEGCTLLAVLSTEHALAKFAMA
ncbi:MAG: hypothetical protein DME26_02230 [Verrucomicrobia bacterium]|nr:MAG: hypothetical protein DME26_02230 [Verrucomicrobiota bacterium]